MHHARLLRPLALLLALAPGFQAQEDLEHVFEETLGATRNVHRTGTLWFAGQFTPEDVALFGDVGIERVITLRTEGEIDWDERAAVEAAGLVFVELPFRAPETLTDELLDELRVLLGEYEGGTLLHCGSATRVGAAWLPFRVLDQGVDLETARAEAKTIGLGHPPYEAVALDYIKRQQQLAQRAPWFGFLRVPGRDAVFRVHFELERPGVKVGDQEPYATTYTPTAARGLGDGRLLVGGTDASGRTVLERWTFTLEGQTQGARITSRGVELLYLGRLPALGAPDCFVELQGASAHALVVCRPGHAFDLNVETGELAPLFDGAKLPALEVPAAWLVLSAEHPRHGYSYLVRTEDNLGASGWNFFDTDKDGRLDRCEPAASGEPLGGWVRRF